jgi:prevent-host-death family protein
MQTINASEFQKRLGEFSDIARREPVAITHDDRPSLVLLSTEDYDRLRRIEERATRTVRTVDLPSETIAVMENADLSHLPVD